MSSANCGARKRFSRPTPTQLLGLRRDPCFETPVQLRDFLGALAQFAEEARVLHRDDRLRCEILQKRDLLV